MAKLDDAALIDAMTRAAAAEAVAAARRLAVIAEFTDPRLGGQDHADWAADDWDAAAVEIAAALQLTLGRASSQMELAMTLRTRLPRVAAQMARGCLSLPVVRTIAARTDLIADRAALAALDEALEKHAVAWGLLSQAKLEAAIDMWVAAVDPAAAHRTRRHARDREIRIGDPNDSDGVTSIFGQLLCTDAKLLDERLTAMARMVCTDDPRTMAQRRADALGALAAGSTHLACWCTVDGCTAAADDGRASSVIVHVLADAQAVAAPADAGLHGEQPASACPDFATAIGEYLRKQRGEAVGRTADSRPTPPPPANLAAPAAETAVSESPAAAPNPVDAQQFRAGLMVGGPIVPLPLLGELIAHGADVEHLRPPGGGSRTGYRPSPALDTWVRMRDLTCRAPGCARPAVAADIDHTIPWPCGPTHPSNTKSYCRKHHLVKTFWPGFEDRQNPDGSVEFSTPTGHNYTTRPFGALMFPMWNTTTAVLREPSDAPPKADERMMPRRRRSRSRQRTYRVNAERKHNAAHDLPPPF